MVGEPFPEAAVPAGERPVLYYDLPTVVAESIEATRWGERSVRAEFYPAGVMRIARKRLDSKADDIEATVVNLRDFAFHPTRSPYVRKDFLDQVAMGKRLLTPLGVDFDQIPAGYPEIEELLQQTMQQPLVPLPELVPGSYYLYAQQLKIKDGIQLGHIRAFKHDSVIVETDAYKREGFRVIREFDPKFGDYGHLAFLKDWGWQPVHPVQLINDWQLLTCAWNSPTLGEIEHFHELSAEDVATISTLQPVVMDPQVRFSSDSALA